MKKLINNSKNQLNNEDILTKIKDEELEKMNHDELVKLVKKLNSDIMRYEEFFKIQNKKRYGASSEKVDKDQVTFFDFDEAVKTVEESEKPIEEPTIETLVKKRRKRREKGEVGLNKDCFKDLEVREVTHDFPEALCDTCGSKLRFLKDEIHEELEVIPPQFIIKRHIIKVYSCSTCEKENNNPIKRSPAPIPAFKGGFASASLVANIMAKKYVEKIPFYRYEQNLKDNGIFISRANMSNWTIDASENYLEGVYNKLHQHLLSQKIIHADETPFQVLKEEGKTAQSKSYIWHFNSAAVAKEQISMYMYKPTRHGKHAAEFLEGFNGYLQTDEYAGYNSVRDITRVGCMAHARRKFTDAITALPKNAEAKATIANEALTRINELFSIEKKLSDLSGEERYRKRLDLAKPKVEALEEWLKSQRPKVSPKSKLGEAIVYFITHFDHLSRYLDDGDLEISNNRSERGIKQFVIGRKNYLFSDSVRGAKSAGVIFTIVETAKANNLNPEKYLTYLINELSQNKQTDEKLEEVMPWSNSIPEDIKVKKQ